MRRKISLILSVLFLVIAVIPMQVFAAEADKGLEDAIRLVKEKFTVPDNFTDFNYNINTEGKFYYVFQPGLPGFVF